MSRKPRTRTRRPSEPATTILTLTRGPVDYSGADLAAVADELGISFRPIPHVTIDPESHPLYREMFAWDEATPGYDWTVGRLGDPLPGRAGAGDVVSGVVVEVREAVAVGA